MENERIFRRDNIPVATASEPPTEGGVSWINKNVIAAAVAAGIFLAPSGGLADENPNKNHHHQEVDSDKTKVSGVVEITTGTSESVALSDDLGIGGSALFIGRGGILPGPTYLTPLESEAGFLAQLDFKKEFSLGSLHPHFHGRAGGGFLYDLRLDRTLFATITEGLLQVARFDFKGEVGGKFGLEKPEMEVLASFGYRLLDNLILGFNMKGRTNGEKYMGPFVTFEPINRFALTASCNAGDYQFHHSTEPHQGLICTTSFNTVIPPLGKKK